MQLQKQADFVMVCCGDTPTQEIMAEVFTRRQYLPFLETRAFNVVSRWCYKKQMILMSVSVFTRII